MRKLAPRTGGYRERLSHAAAHSTRLFVAFVLCASIVQAQAQEIICPTADVPDYREHTSGGSVNWASYQDLPAVPAVHAWERVRVTVTDTVNINRELYEERECSWFGLKCWYEKRVRNNIVRPENVPFLWNLRKQKQPSDDDLKSSINQSGAVIELHPDWPTYWGRSANPTDNHTLMGQVGTDNITRLGCQGEPTVCSHGAYKIKIEIDSAPRARRLIEELKQKRIGYVGVMNENFLNDNLRNSSPQTRACTAEALLEQARRFFGNASGASERQKLLLEALNHNATNKSAQTLLGSTYLETGQFDEARKTATGTAADNEKLILSGKGTAKTYMELADNYATLAEVGWRETAGDSTRAALDAVGYLTQARERLLSRLEKLPLDQIEGFTSEEARKRLSNYSSRLAAIRARLGTPKDLLDAIDPPADTLKRLPLRYPDATPYEVDAVQRTLFAVRNREPVFSDRSWQLEASSLPLSSSYALTSLYFDPLSKPASAADATSGIVAFEAGPGPQRAFSVDDVLAAGTASEILFQPASSCVSHAGRYETRTDAALLSHKVESGEMVTYITRNSGGANPVSLGRKIRAAGIVRAAGSAPRLGLVRFGSTAANKWEFEIDATRVEVDNDRSGTDARLRISPNGEFFAVGINNQGIMRWRLIHKKTTSINELTSRPLTCRVNGQDKPFDDVALTRDGLIAIGSSCPFVSADYPKIPDTAPLTIETHLLDKLHPAASDIVEALRERRGSFAWFNDLSSPFAITSWSEGSAGLPIPATYKIVIVRPPNSDPIIQPATFVANIAEWAAPNTSALECEGKKLEIHADREQFRITNVSIVKQSELVDGQTQAFDRPRVAVTSVGTIGAFVSLRSSDRRSARCNTIEYQDIQADADGRVWAIRSADSALMKLNAPDAKQCESPVKLSFSPLGKQRVYRASSVAEEPLQVFDFVDRGVLSALTQIPLAAHKSDAALASPAACSFIGETKFMACSPDEIIAAAGAPAGSQVRVLLRDISSDARGERTKINPVERPTALAIVEPVSAGARRVRIYRLPLTSFGVHIVRSIPQAALPIGMLSGGQTAVLVVLDGNEIKAVKDEAGTITGSVTLPPTDWTWTHPNTRWLMVGQRLIIVKGSADNNVEGDVRAITFASETSVQQATGKIQAGKISLEIAKKLGLWPLPTRMGQIESFAISDDLLHLQRPATPTAPNYESWAPIDLGAGAKVLKLVGAGVPLMINQNRIYVSSSESLIESWELPR